MTGKERREKIEKIRKLPDELEETIRGLDDQQLNTPYGEGKWTVRQVVHHLADSHLNAFVRMKLIATENLPALKPYDQDEWAKLYDSTSLPVRSSVAILRGLHERWCALMDHMPEAGWGRKGMHPEHGELTVEGILNMYANHGKNHLDQIRNLKAARKW